MKNCKLAGTSPMERMAEACGVPLEFAIKFAALVELGLFPEEYDPDEDPEIKATLESLYLATLEAPVEVDKQPDYQVIALNPDNGERVERHENGSVRKRISQEQINLRGAHYPITAGVIPDGLPNVVAADFQAFLTDIKNHPFDDED